MDRPVDPPADASANVERVLVLIPARNESAVIGDVIRDLGRQDLLGDDRVDVRIVIVDDGSDDATGELAVAAVAAAALASRATVLRREGPTTKGAALQAAQLSAGPPLGTVVVLDADARIDPGFLRRAILASGGRPANARRRLLAPPPGIGLAARALARLQDDEQTVDAAIRRIRWFLRGGSELRGDGMVVPAPALAAIGGWPVDALCEDLEASTALYLQAGLATRPLSDVVVWEQPVLDPRELLRQRLRWAEGAIRRDLRLVWPRLGDAGIPLHRRLDGVAYASQMLLGIGVGVLAISGRRGRTVCRWLLGGYALAGIALAFAVLRREDAEGCTGPGGARAFVVRSARALGVVTFGTSWPIVTAITWVRLALGAGRPRFEPTRKRAGFRAPWDPVPGPPRPPSASPGRP